MNDIPERLREKLRASRTPVLDAVLAGRVSPEDAFLAVDRSFRLDAVLAVASALVVPMAASFAIADRSLWPMWVIAALNVRDVIRYARSWRDARRKHIDAAARVNAALEAKTDKVTT